MSSLLLIANIFVSDLERNCHNYRTNKVLKLIYESGTIQPFMPFMSGHELTEGDKFIYDMVVSSRKNFDEIYSDDSCTKWIQLSKITIILAFILTAFSGIKTANQVLKNDSKVEVNTDEEIVKKINK